MGELSAERRTVRLTVNGASVERLVEPRTTLADALRDAGLTGTRLGCEQGVCGACTVLIDDEPVRSCLAFAVQYDGDAQITTIEGLADDDRLTALQDAFSRHHALQCGFCTPGFVLLATALLNADDRSDEALLEGLAANLCRCTGYAGIVAAVREVRDEL